MLKQKLTALICTCFISSALLAQSTTQNLNVVSWNVEWFGAPGQTPTDDNLQEANVKKVLRQLNADIYGLLEVVDTMRLRRLTDSLGSAYKFVIADYCTSNTTGTGASWLSGQKQAFIYNKNIFTNVRTRGMMRKSGSAFISFASGRFPFLLNADMTVNGVTRNMNFILIHGKSGSTQTDYDKRSEGANELKDTLDTYFSSSMNIVLGDYNDALDKTICTTCGTNISSYDALVKDSTDADHYKSLTLPAARAGQTTMINFPNVIDNHVVSNELEAIYVAGSAAIRTDITALIPNYNTDNTSDHYPVSSQYSFTTIVTSVPSVPPAQLGINIYPNPFGRYLFIRCGKALSNVQMRLSDAGGKTMFLRSFQHINAAATIASSLPVLAPGTYFLIIKTKDGQAVQKLVKQ